jgi:DNA-binding MarR family transcriptional regulator
MAQATRADATALAALDAALVRLRRLTARLPKGEATLPGTECGVDLATVFACEAVADLSAQDRLVTVKDVAAHLDLEHSTASRLLSQTEGEGLVARATHPSDRRSTVVSLTPRGAALVESTRPLRLAFVQHLLADWERSDVETLAALLTRLADDVQERHATFPAFAAALHASVSQSSPGSPGDFAQIPDASSSAATTE